MLGRKSKNCSPVFLRYDTILLKTYFEIANTEDFMLMLLKGEATLVQCKEKWNAVVSANFENSGTLDFIGYIDSLEGYNSFLLEHNVTTAELLMLHFQVDDVVIADLRERGYNIDTTGKRAYADSLARAMERSKSLLSRIKLKSNELENFTEHLKENKPVSYQDVLTTLMFNLGFSVPDDITLASFNKFRNLIIESRKYQQQIEA